MRAIGGRAAAIVAAFVLTSAAACTDEDPTPPPPTTSSSTPTSPTPTSSSPAPQPESAEDFIRRWVDADIRMQNTGDSGEYRALSQSCSSCGDFAERIEGIYQRGGYVKTKGWRILGISRQPGSTTRRPIYLLRVDSRPTTYRESKSGPTKSLPGERTAYRVSLLRSSDGHWQVIDLIETST